MKNKKSIYILGAAVLFLLGIFVGQMFPRQQSENASLEEIEEGLSDEKTPGEQGDILIPEEVFEELEQLESFVDYAIEKYCGESGEENTYEYSLFENMMHPATYIPGKVTYTFDLDKVILPELTNNRFTLKIAGQNNTIFVVIDTYRMKMCIYEDKKGKLRVVDGSDCDLSAEKEDDLVQGDWDDMWAEEYNQFVINGYEYLTTPSFDDKMHINPDLYGMVIYSLQRYCEENGIKEMFYFEFPEDEISNATFRILTVKVESENRILYMDIDLDRNKVHIYQVQD